MLGRAAHEVGRAYVFYDRIVRVTQTRPVDANVMLARVIAHEVGHLLLPPGSHSLFGIMQADFDVNSVQPCHFTGDEIALMQSLLR